MFIYRTTDCILSSNDISWSYKYCCYDSSFDYTCQPYTEDSYKDKFGDLTPNFCNTQTSKASGCESVIPNSASDCVLSKEDKDNGKIYCCYTGDKTEKRCSAETEETYEFKNALFKELGGKEDFYQCGESGKFISLSLIALFLMILNL